MPRT
ncbi:unnamed protein product, partial [Rotaria sordida]